MERVSIDSLDNGVSKWLRIFAKLSSLAFEELSFKPYRHFLDVEIVSADHKKRTATVIQ